MLRHFDLRAAGALALLSMLTACSYQVGYRPDYVPPERPPYIAHGKILIVLPKDESQFVYKGGPASSVGDYTTLTIPIGQILRDISDKIFTACFADGVEFANDRSAGKQRSQPARDAGRFRTVAAAELAHGHGSHGRGLGRVAARCGSA